MPTKFSDTKDFSLEQDSVLVDDPTGKVAMRHLNVSKDGNCAFDPVAITLINAIRTKQLDHLTEEQFKKFLLSMKSRIKELEGLRDYYKKGAKQILCPLIDRFIKHVLTSTPECTLAHFKQYVGRQTSRAEMAALTLSLQPGLRHLSNPTLKLREHGGDEEARKLCEFFGLNLKVYQKQVFRDKSTYSQIALRLTMPVIAQRPTVNMLHNGHNHFDALVPEVELAESSHPLHALEESPMEVDNASHVSKHKEHKDHLRTMLHVKAGSEEQKEFDELYARRVHEKLQHLADNEDDGSAFETAMQEMLDSVEDVEVLTEEEIAAEYQSQPKSLHGVLHRLRFFDKAAAAAEQKDNDMDVDDKAVASSFN